LGALLGFKRMPAIVALIIAFLIGLVLRICGRHMLIAWLFSCCVIPVFVLTSEFILPYMGGGASMWPIALLFGGIYGAISGGLGTIVASIYLKLRCKSTQPDT
jgi:hypothetical protein